MKERLLIPGLPPERLVNRTVSELKNLITIRDVSIMLGITEKEVVDLAESGAIPAYKIAGVYLRFKREQIEEFKKSFKPSAGLSRKGRPSFGFSSRDYPLKDRVSDFFYFNDFYILAAIFVLLALVFILRG